MPVLGTGENKGRWGAWGKKLLTIFWKLLEETRSTADLNSVEHRSRTLPLVYFSRYDSTTLFTYTPILSQLNHNGALITVYSVASCRSTPRILQPRPSSFLSSAIANRGEAKVEGIEALGRMGIAKFENDELELT